MLKKIALGIIAVIAAILIIAAFQPNTFRVQRTATIKARPEKIVPLIADFHRWSSWSPYEKLDPAMKRTINGAPSGPGAVYEWDGNNKAGAGRMEVLSASPAAVKIKLDFTRPFASHNMAEFTLEPHGDTTNVTWSMSGPQMYIGKVVCLFMNMDRMVGKEFETGLASLKAIAEKSISGV
ncbi:MAG: hypothetical protein QOI24_1371 [Acidobacteriota bacterium]|jgi:hypothetical protein|nr:hypothetical protein [Acidobacteriota bacterium]